MGIGRVKYGTQLNIRVDWKRWFMVYLNCEGHYLWRPGSGMRKNSEETDMWVEGAYDCWWWTWSNQSLVSSILTHVNLMTLSNLTIFIANAFQISPAKGFPLNYRFIDITSYLSFQLGYIINPSILLSETEVLISLLIHIGTSHLTAFPFSAFCNFFFHLLMSKILESSSVLFYLHRVHQQSLLALSWEYW